MMTEKLKNNGYGLPELRAQLDVVSQLLDELTKLQDKINCQFEDVKIKWQNVEYYLRSKAGAEEDALYRYYIRDGGKSDESNGH